MISADEAMGIALKATPFFIALGEVDRQITLAAEMGRRFVSIKRTSDGFANDIIDALDSVGFAVHFENGELHVSW